MSALPNDLLTKLDRCLMGFGIEGMTPFLDPVVADFAFRLPDDLEIRDGLGKWLRKRGTTLGPLVARQAGLREICLPEAVERLYATLDGKRRGFAAWSLLFYALWHRAHIQRPVPERDVFQTLSALDG